jgi:hypothetical protein
MPWSPGSLRTAPGSMMEPWETYLVTVTYTGPTSFVAAAERFLNTVGSQPD